MNTDLTTTKPALPPEIAARVAEAKQRNAVVAAIRGTVWGKDLSAEQVRAVAQYAHDHDIDATRHVEILGGRLYLTAEFYDERGADLVSSGVVQPLEPDLIQHDPRLDTLADAGDAWATAERTRRMRLRIQYGVPEKAAAAAVARFRITSTGAEVVGVNWCGGGVRPRDPVGEAEPVKTAITRARRRAWRQLVAVVPQLADRVAPLQASAQAVEARLLEVAPAPVARLGSGALPSTYDDPLAAPTETPRTVVTARPPVPDLPAGVDRDPYDLEEDAA